LGHPGAISLRLALDASKEALDNPIKKEELVSNAPPERSLA